MRNADLHRGIQLEMVTNEIKKFAKKHEERVLHHDNVERRSDPAARQQWTSAKA